MNDLNRRISDLCEQLESVGIPRKRLPLLDELGSCLAQVDPIKGAACAREQLRIARSIGDDYPLAVSCMQAAEYARLRSRYSQGFRYLKTARLLLEKTPDRLAEQSRLCRIYGGLLGDRTGDLDAVLQMFTQGLEYARLSGDRKEINAALLSFAEACCSAGLFEDAFDGIGECLESISDGIVSDSGGRSFRLLGLIHREFEDWEPALDRMKKSLDIYNRIGSLFGQAESYRGLGLICLEMGNYDQASAALQSSATLFERLEQRLPHSLVLAEISCIQTARKDFASALALCAKAAAMQEGVGNDTARGLLLLAQGEALAANEDWSKALPLLKEGLRNVRKGGLLSGIRRAHQALARTYEALGDHSGALAHQKTSIELKRRGVNGQVPRKLLELEFKEADKKNDRDNADRETGDAGSNEGGHSARSPAAALRLAATDELLGRVRKRIHSLERRDGESEDHIREIVREIDAGRDAARVWEELEKRMGQTDPDFLHELATLYPKLTPAELRICSLLRMNLSNSEIVDLLNVSGRTVDTHRGRIRKKMGLGKEEDLVEALRNIGG